MKLPFLASVLVLSFAASAGAVRAPDQALPGAIPAPTFPVSGETPIETPRLSKPVDLGAVHTSSAALRAALETLAKNPKTLGLAGYTLRLDPIPTGGTGDLRYAHLVQQEQGLDVHGGDVMVTLRTSSGSTQVVAASGRLYPEARRASALAADAAAAPQGDLKTAEAAGASIFWLEGRWQAVQLFRMQDRGMVAAVNGDGKIYVWDTRVY